MLCVVIQWSDNIRCNYKSSTTQKLGMTLSRKELLFWREQLGPEQGWPRGLWRLFRGDRHGNPQIFSLTIFLLGNGVAPWMINEHYRRYNLNAGAHWDVKSIIAKYGRGGFAGRTYWDVFAQRTRQI